MHVVHHVMPVVPVVPVVPAEAARTWKRYMADALGTYESQAKTANLQDVEVLKEFALLSVKPACTYFERVVLGDCADQIARLAAARIFDPLHVLATGVSMTDVETLAQVYRFFKLEEFSELPAAMVAEIPAYLASVKEIRPLSQRLDTDGKDTFDMQDFWRAKEGALPAWAKVLGAVLCHVPNSAPPERAFSILNNSIGDDQYAALADYKKALIQVQYNSRRRGN